MGDRARTIGRWLLVSNMLGIGILHFVADDLFVQMVPPSLPWPLALVWLSGVVEIGLALALVPPRTRRVAGLGLVGLYVAVFPANVYMAVANLQVHGLPPWLPQPSAAALWVRLPFQLGFMAWAVWASGLLKGKVVDRAGLTPH